MGFFDKLIGQTPDERIYDLYSKTNSWLNDSNMITMNVGYYPSSNIVQEKDTMFKNDITMYLRMLDNIDTHSKTILDIGCGRGGGTVVYQEYFKFKKIVGIDINKDLIDFCNKKHKDIEFHIMDIDNISFNDNSFDIVTAIESLYYCKNQTKLFNNINKIIKHEGYFIISDSESVINFNSLNNVFNDVKKINITENIINSSKEIIKNISKYDLSKEEKEYILYCSNNNYMHYTSSNDKFYKVVCRNGV